MPYSRKDFTGQNLTERTDMSGQTITGSCFSQEVPDTVVFPAAMSGVTFINCNLDNCFIPEGNTVEGGSTRRFEMQNDLNDWEIDESGDPVRLVNYRYFEKMGLDQPLPEDIPDELLDEAVDYMDPARNVRA